MTNTQNSTGFLRENNPLPPTAADLAELIAEDANYDKHCEPCSTQAKLRAALPTLLTLQAFVDNPQEKIREALERIERLECPGCALRGMDCVTSCGSFNTENIEPLAALLSTELFAAPATQPKEGKPE